MPEITVGELLMQSLKAEGVDLMVGIVDGAHIPLVVHAKPYGVRYVNAHHEEAAVHIAEGYARIARKPAVALGNPGPGGANMLAGLSSAYGEGHPVVAIACTRRSAVNYPDRGGAWQATDLVEMARPITKYSALIARWDRVLGDGLVPLDSALGRHAEPRHTLAFAPERQWIGHRIGHLELLSHPEVYAQLRRWLA